MDNITLKKNMSKTRGWKTMAVCLVIVLSAVSGVSFAETGAKKSDDYFSTGFGIGIPYGVVGFNLEFNPVLPGMAEAKIHDYFSLSLGIGYSPGGLAYSIGARVYPMGREKKIRPRVSGYYGIVALIEYSYYDDYDRMEGFAFGGGVLYKLSKKFSADFDILYIMPNNYSHSLEGGRLKLSLGSRWHF